MAVREKTLTRTVCSVKHLPTGSTHPVIAHKKFWSAAVLLPLLRSVPRHRIQQPAREQPGHGSQSQTHFFKYFSYHAKIRFNRSTKCFSSRNPCGSRG